MTEPEICNCAVAHESDEVARSLGWHMERRSAGTDFDDRERFNCLWVNEAGEVVMCVWDFRRWGGLARELKNKFGVKNED